MATHTATILVDDQPISTVTTDSPVVIEIQRRFTRSQAKKESEKRSTILKSKHANGSLYYEMQEWQDKFDEVTDAWVFDDTKEPIEDFIQLPDLPAYYKMVALLARCLPDLEPEPEPDQDKEEEGKQMEIQVEMDEDRKKFMAEAKKAYEECLKVYTRDWDRESVEEAWSTWPN